MRIIADLQIHSKHSRAVSYKMDVFEIARWASIKGIQLVATGDWQHPVWFKELTTHLREVSDGIYTLKQKPNDQQHDVYFLLSSELSSIYTHHGKGRRIHNLIWSPSFETSRKIIKALQNYGANLMSDGRPIVGISSKDLLSMILDIDPRCMLIPAHVWTPWFGHFGSMSGYDSLQECYEDMSPHIHAIETGLSSDPIMNWQIKELENRSIVSFSDAHSGPKLGREATVFETIGNNTVTMEDVTYDDVAAAVKQDPRGRLRISHTIEFFPEEGKYHWDGHRKCEVKYSPYDTKKNGTTCPVCKRPVTIGVEHRILTLAHTSIDPSADVVTEKDAAGLTFVHDKERKRKPFVSCVPLLEILREINNGSKTKSERAYEQLTSRFAPEFDILLKRPYEEIQKHGGQMLATAIQLLRERRVTVNPGYDGVFGTVSLLNNHENHSAVPENTKQDSLF